MVTFWQVRDRLLRSINNKTNFNYETTKLWPEHIGTASFFFRLTDNNEIYFSSRTRKPNKRERVYNANTLTYVKCIGRRYIEICERDIRSADRLQFLGRYIRIKQRNRVVL